MKPQLVEKGCWNCKYGHIPLADSNICSRCLQTNSHWKLARHLDWKAKRPAKRESSHGNW